MKKDCLKVSVVNILMSYGSGTRLVAGFALLLAMLLWGSSFVAMKYAFVSLHPMIVIFCHMAVAALCFLPFVPSFFRMGLSRQHLLPLLVAVMSGLFLAERMSHKTVIGFIIAAVGALWLSMAGPASEQAPNPLLENLLEFMVMVSATGYIILMKYLSRTLPVLFLTAMQAFIGTLFFGPLLLLPAVQFPQSLSLPAILSVLYLGIFVTVGAYGLYNFALSRVPANQAAAFINLIPVWTLIFGFVLLDERLSAPQLAACAVVFSGVFLCKNSTAE